MARKLHEVFVRSEKKVDDYDRAFPPKAEVKTDLLHLIERRVNLLFVYTSGAIKYYNYKGQFKDMFNLVEMNERSQVEYFEEATHTYTRLDDRNRLMTCICDWMHKHYNVSE